MQPHPLMDQFILQSVDAARLEPHLAIAESSGSGNPELETFKQQVKMWMSLDVQIRRLQLAVRERKQYQTELNQSILAFMAKNGIDDLNTQDGILRYKQTNVRVSVPQTKIKDRLKQKLQERGMPTELVDEAFAAGFKEKTSLRRIKY